jgi:hypothetical protein
MRYPVIVLLITILFLTSCLVNGREKSPQNVPQVIGDVKLYAFSSDDRYFLSNAQPFILPPDTSLRDALQSLGQHLSATYFSKTHTGEVTDIHFEILRIERVSTPSRPLLTAIVNMVDVNKDALGYFFQGSTGGQTTFCMLTATFMQPHLEAPLLDGLVILYNGELLEELDHINLSGLLIPRLAEYVAKRAIHNTERKRVECNPDRRRTIIRFSPRRSECTPSADSEGLDESLEISSEASLW